MPAPPTSATPTMCPAWYQPLARPFRASSTPWAMTAAPTTAMRFAPITREQGGGRDQRQGGAPEGDQREPQHARSDRRRADAIPGAEVERRRRARRYRASRFDTANVLISLHFAERGISV